MSLKYIGLFQDALYELLRSSVELKREVSGIYLSVQQDAKYPFILLNLTYATDLSKFTRSSYEIEFEICLFSRDKSQHKILIIADLVSELIRPDVISIDDYRVLSIKKYKIEWIRGQDILTTKIVVKYKALISLM